MHYQYITGKPPHGCRNRMLSVSGWTSWLRYRLGMRSKSRLRLRDGAGAGAGMGAGAGAGSWLRHLKWQLEPHPPQISRNTA